MAPVQGTLVAVATAGHRGRWWAEAHDDRGLFAGEGSYGSSAQATAAAKLLVARLTARVDTNAQLVALRLASPKRAEAGHALATQHDASDCPLFAAADQGRLL